MSAERQPRVRVGVVVERKGNVLLVCHRKADRRYWMLPGGGLQWGETLFRCGEREVLEETGLRVEAGRLVYVAETVAPDGNRHVINMVITARLLGGSLRTPTEEIIDTVEWWPIGQLPALTLYPPIGSLVREGLEKGFSEQAVHLGTLWAE